MTHPRSPLFRTSVCLLGAAAVLLAPFAGKSARAATPDEVNQALAKGREFIYSKMNAQNNWEEVPQPDPKKGGADVQGKQWGGLSAIAVYALLASGENPQSPKLAAAIKWLQDAPITGTYALGLRAQIWLFVKEDKQNKLRVNRDASVLLKGIYPATTKDKDHAGFYAYWTNPMVGPQENWYDRSVSQYGVLGMWACEQAGAEIPLDYWRLVDLAWKNAQEKAAGPDQGGWNYQTNKDQKIKPTMTAAGVATLFITQDYLLTQSNWGVCKGGLPNPNIDAGLAYMDRHVGELLGGDFYGMYGVERIGVASGRKYFGTIDWYKVGADFLVHSQDKASGNWGGSIPNTCFAMLFLSRGRAPIVMNKLEYDLVDPKTKKEKVLQPWNQRPRDVANFAHWASKQTEAYLNWQVVNLKVSPDDLHDAPILYISGSTPLDFDDAAVAKLREFAEDGGLILFNADCGNDAFTKSITGPKGLGQKLFPKYEFRKLPDSHPIYTEEQFKAGPSKWKAKPDLVGMSNGVRELLLVAPESDPGRAWQTRAEKTKSEPFEVVEDVFLYTISKNELRQRGQTYIVHADPNAQAPDTIKVARIQVGENADPEPGGWRRLANVMHNTARTNLVVEPVKLGEGKLAGYKVAHLTGTTSFTLRPEQRQELMQFMGKGGTLVIDAAGGSGEFKKAAEAELAQMFGGQPGAVGDVLAPGHLVYNWPGFKIDKVVYRNYVTGRLSGKLSVPRVRGVEQGGQVICFYSPEDLSAGLVGQPTDGILGYAPNSATDLMRNILIYAAAGGRPPPPSTTKPATQPGAAPGTNPPAPQPPAPAAPSVAQPAPPAQPAAPAPAAPAPAAPAANGAK